MEVMQDGLAKRQLPQSRAGARHNSIQTHTTFKISLQRTHYDQNAIIGHLPPGHYEVKAADSGTAPTLFALSILSALSALSERAARKSAHGGRRGRQCTKHVGVGVDQGRDGRGVAQRHLGWGKRSARSMQGMRGAIVRKEIVKNLRYECSPKAIFLRAGAVESCFDNCKSNE
ncbi:hypothetical protein [Duganella vulcania]|uniref:Uncharacterized protein n=1 Tax=Duganella vulcania TaxID=2692166 RepID=A0A845GGW3_9BURK|nr:hypothetical protein [Duganella vulcania]MYM92238.1 hypothetical protein [Duganella vulcania]